MIAYFAGLLYFAANPDKIVNRRRFRLAWMLFAVVVLISGFFTFLRTFTVGFTRSMAIIEIIGNALSWTVLGISLIIVLGAILPRDDGT
jgi:hypothetical protein